MQQTLLELQYKCQEKGLLVVQGEGKKKLRRQDYIKALAINSIKEKDNVTWGLLKRVQLDSLMLSYSFKNLKEYEKEILWTSSSWVAEKKYNGCRMLICYHPSEGYTFFSRNISIKDYLPLDYTKKILLKHNNNVFLGSHLAKEHETSFVLDSEVVVKGDVDLSYLDELQGETIRTEQNIVAGILSSDLALNLQEEISLTFKVFDILEYNNCDFKGCQYQNRREKLEYLFDSCFFDKVPFELSTVYRHNKIKAYENFVNSGGEGFVFKNINAFYLASNSRNRRVQVKLKRSMNEAIGMDVDAFISGFVESSVNKSWRNLIAGIKLSVFLQDGDQEKEHWIATVSGIPFELREKMSDKVDGKVVLNPFYLGKVLTIDGQSISAKSLRFNHAVVNSWNFRTDKSYFDCVFDKKVLLENVI